MSDERVYYGGGMTPISMEEPVSERDEFEAAMGWKLKDSQGKHALSRAHDSQQTYTFLATYWAYEAWKAARATPQQAVPALTDEQILDIGYAAKIVRSAGHWPLSERLVSIAAKQSSQGPEHQHHWGYFTDTKTYRCRCGAETSQYPLGPSGYKD